jgi:hypothetical protein
MATKKKSVKKTVKKSVKKIRVRFATYRPAEEPGSTYILPSLEEVDKFAKKFGDKRTLGDVEIHNIWVDLTGKLL